jgi:LysM repeat protein
MILQGRQHSTTRATHYARVALAACVLCVALVLAGCQSGASTGSNDQVRLLVTPVASPTPTPPAQPTAQPVTYVVKQGDTLSGIADMFGVTVDDIVRINNITDPNSLQVGQTLAIPGRQSDVQGGTATPAGTPAPPTPGPGTPRAETVTPVIVLPTTLPADATPPQGPDVPEPQEGASSAPSPAISPTVAP